MTVPPTDVEMLASLRHVMAVEGARLEEMAAQYREDEAAVAEKLERAAKILEESREEIHRVADAAAQLRDADLLLERRRQPRAAIQIRNLRRRLTLAADALAHDTQRMTTGEYPVHDPDEP